MFLAQCPQLKTLRIHAELSESNAAVLQKDREKQVREIENADYLKTHKDYSESIDALEKAINVLKKQAADVPQELVQLKTAEFIPESARRVISAFLAQGDELGQEPE